MINKNKIIGDFSSFSGISKKLKKIITITVRPWILASNVWDDSGIWDDTETWND